MASRANLQINIGLWYAKRFEILMVHGDIIMLAGVNQGYIEFCSNSGKGCHDRSHFHEIWARAYDT